MDELELARNEVIGLIEALDLWAECDDELGDLNTPHDHDLIVALRQSMEAAAAKLRIMGY